MKTKLQLAALLCASTFILHPSAFGQGALTPPVGAPAPVMKSLDQIEARTPITNRTSTFTITQPGSYYLTGNLTVSSGTGVLITTNGVTLDLNGYTIRSTYSSGSSGAGVYLDSGSSAVGLRDIAIKNGHIQSGRTNNGSGVYSGPGFFSGIARLVGTGDPMNVSVSHVSVSGCAAFGIYLGTAGSTVVEQCTVQTMGQLGIYGSTVKSCLAVDCGSTAILADQVADSRGESYADSGIYATVAQNCYGLSISGTGIQATTANNCVGYRTSGTAIKATVANGCYASSGTNLITYKYNMP